MMVKAVNFSVEARSRSIHTAEENEFLIRKFVRKTKKSGLIENFKNRMFYEKPSAVRRRKKKNKRKKSREITAQNHKF